MPLVACTRRFRSVWYAVAYRVLKQRDEDTSGAVKAETALTMLGHNLAMAAALYDAAGVAVADPSWQPGERIPAPTITWS